MATSAARHTSQEFVEFLTAVVEPAPAREIHIILDNLSAHKSPVVCDFLAAHPNVPLHFTPTYWSWLNQVEIWFATVERDVIARGIFTSVQDLARKLRRYINAYSAHAKPIRWKYSDPTRRIRTNVIFATCHYYYGSSTTWPVLDRDRLKPALDNDGSREDAFCCVNANSGYC